MLLKRQLEVELQYWRDDVSRKPLLVRGARQVGKSSLIEAFGRAHFENVVTVNFELEAAYKKCFSSLKPEDICNAIRVVSQQEIVPGKTLLFLDEIQDCPEAIQSLRYFKELLPELHVIGAGSLLELVLNHANYRLPVGRVSFLYLYPLSFKEFLWAMNPEVLPYIERATLAAPLPEAMHEQLIKQLKLYFLIGGMPEAVSDYTLKRDLLSVQRVQAHMIETYEYDLSHYTKAANHADLQRCFRQIPSMIGQQIKYNKLSPDARSAALKIALSTLESAGICHRIYETSAKGLPLDSTVNEKKFKMNAIDVGVVKRFEQLDTRLLLDDDVMLLNQGALAEQFVGQELVAYGHAFEKTKLYFWARDGQNTAEVDYLTVVRNQIYPIEVKAGKSGKLQSLKQYLREHDCPFGIRVSTLPLSLIDQVLSVPLYMIAEIPRLVGSPTLTTNP